MENHRFEIDDIVLVSTKFGVYKGRVINVVENQNGEIQWCDCVMLENNAPVIEEGEVIRQIPPENISSYCRR